MIRPNKPIPDQARGLEPFAPIPPEVLDERRAILRETAGCWSPEEADRIATELQKLFGRPDENEDRPV